MLLTLVIHRMRQDKSCEGRCPASSEKPGSKNVCERMSWQELNVVVVKVEMRRSVRYGCGQLSVAQIRTVVNEFLFS